MTVLLVVVAPSVGPPTGLPGGDVAKDVESAPDCQPAGRHGCVGCEQSQQRLW